MLRSSLLILLILTGCATSRAPVEDELDTERSRSVAALATLASRLSQTVELQDRVKEDGAYKADLIAAAERNGGNLKAALAVALGTAHFDNLRKIEKKETARQALVDAWVEWYADLVEWALKLVKGKLKPEDYAKLRTSLLANVEEWKKLRADEAKKAAGNAIEESD